MVNIGFICEGDSDSFILKSEKFNSLLLDLKLNCVGVIDSGGNGNLLPRNIDKHRQNLIRDGAKIIFILTDLDEDQCITKTRIRIAKKDDNHVIIAVKQMESWFLADTITMKSILKGNFYWEYPERENVPFETIRKIYLDKFSRGIVGKDEKKKLANKMINTGFSIQNAAAHPNCPSALYFLNKLKSIN